MAYLVKNDYKNYIQGDYLRQLTQGDDTKRVDVERQSMQTILQRLTQKYDLALEFTDTLPYSNAKVYGAADRAVIALSVGGFKAWEADVTYAAGAPVIQEGSGYFCVTPNSDSTFIADNWSLAGPLNSIFYAAWPTTCTREGRANPATLTDPYAPMFNYQQLYSVNDVVWWAGRTYSCKIASTRITHQAALQYVAISNLPYSNVFPTDQANSTGQYWELVGDYNVPVGTPLTDTTYWVSGDNRNQTIKMDMVVLTVFRLSPLISPGNVSEAWLEDYRGVLRDLNDAAMGNMTMILPPRQPQTGLKTRYGGDIKNVNNY